MPLDPTRSYATCGASMIAQPDNAYEHPRDAAIANFRKLDDEDTWLGTISVFGQAMHFYAIRVTEDADGIQVATNDPHDRFRALDHLDIDGAFQTAEIPGLDGEFVFVAHSYL